MSVASLPLCLPPHPAPIRPANIANPLNSPRRDKFDHIVIETTGLANPAPIIQTFYIEDVLKDGCVLDGVLTVVDAKNIHLHLDEKKKEGIVNEALEQVAFADRLILNKTDLVEGPELAKLEARLKSINAVAAIRRTERSVRFASPRLSPDFPPFLSSGSTACLNGLPSDAELFSSGSPVAPRLWTWTTCWAWAASTSLASLRRWISSRRSPRLRLLMATATTRPPAQTPRTTTVRGVPPLPCTSPAPPGPARPQACLCSFSPRLPFLSLPQS